MSSVALLRQPAFAPALTRNPAPPRGGSLLQRKCACGGTPGPSGECEECRKKRLGTVQRLAAGGAATAVAPPSVHQVLQSAGQPLDASTRGFFEPRLGRALGRTAATPVAAAASALPISQPGDFHEREAERIAAGLFDPGRADRPGGPRYDLSSIRIHTDRRAAESAGEVDALAYTVGTDVVFGDGLYSPGTSSGMRLLAHELVHTAQQNPGLAREPKVKGSHDPQPKIKPLGGCLGSAVCDTVKTPSKLLAEARTDEVNTQREKRAKDCGKTPLDPACRADGHAARAVEVEKLLMAFDPTRLKNAQGIFVDKDIEGDFGAVTTTCNTFTPPLAASGQCITVPQKMEDNAKLFNTTTGPLTIDGKERGLWRERTLEILVHEAGHVEFRTSFLPGFQSKFSNKVPNIMGKPRATCKADNASKVDVFSSANELTAMVQEFPLRMDRIRTSVSLATPEAKAAELEEWRDHRMRGTSQSITNSLRVIRCLCGCEDANDIIKESIEFATTAWDQNQKNDLHREMRNPIWKDLDLRWPFIAPGLP